VGMGPRDGAGDKKGRPGVSGAVAAGRNRGFRPCCGRPLREERGRIGMTGGPGLAAGEEGRAGRERAHVAAARVGERSVGSGWAAGEKRERRWAGGRDGSGRGPRGGKEGRGVLGLGWPMRERGKRRETRGENGPGRESPRGREGEGKLGLAGLGERGFGLALSLLFFSFPTPKLFKQSI
jgi:hypothetical protein